MPGRVARVACMCEHVGRQIGDGFLGGLFLPDPTLSADLGQRRLAFGAADVLLHQLDLRGRDVNFGLFLEFEDQVLLDLPFLLQQLQSAIAADAVREVDDIIPFAQLEKAVDDPAQFAAGPNGAGRCDGTARRR